MTGRSENCDLAPFHLNVARICDVKRELRYSVYVTKRRFGSFLLDSYEFDVHSTNATIQHNFFSSNNHNNNNIPVIPIPNAIISSVSFNDKPINYSFKKRFCHGSRHEFRLVWCEGGVQTQRREVEELGERYHRLGWYVHKDEFWFYSIVDLYIGSHPCI